LEETGLTCLQHSGAHEIELVDGGAFEEEDVLEDAHLAPLRGVRHVGVEDDDGRAGHLRFSELLDEVEEVVRPAALAADQDVGDGQGYDGHRPLAQVLQDHVLAALEDRGMGLGDAGSRRRPCQQHLRGVLQRHALRVIPAVLLVVLRTELPAARGPRAVHAAMPAPVREASMGKLRLHPRLYGRCTHRRVRHVFRDLAVLHCVHNRPRPVLLQLHGGHALLPPPLPRLHLQVSELRNGVSAPQVPAYHQAHVVAIHHMPLGMQKHLLDHNQHLVSQITGSTDNHTLASSRSSKCRWDQRNLVYLSDSLLLLLVKHIDIKRKQHHVVLLEHKLHHLFRSMLSVGPIHNEQQRLEIKLAGAVEHHAHLFEKHASASLGKYERVHLVVVAVEVLGHEGTLRQRLHLDLRREEVREECVEPLHHAAAKNQPMDMFWCCRDDDQEPGLMV
jgi:hypothetical protein